MVAMMPPSHPTPSGALPKGEPWDALNNRGVGFALCLCNTKAKLATKQNGGSYGLDIFNSGYSIICFFLFA